MGWIEIIELRSSGNHREELESEMEELIAEVEGEAGPESITAYSRDSVGADFSVHLVHDALDVEESGSALGLHLAATLRKFGLVSHTVWVRMPGRHSGAAPLGKERER